MKTISLILVCLFIAAPAAAWQKVVDACGWAWAREGCGCEACRVIGTPPPRA